MTTITPCLWFDGRVQEAIDFYSSLFPDSELLSASRYPEGSPGQAGDIMVATFRILGQEIMIINGGPQYPLTPAVSLCVGTRGQQETDRLWDALVDGGEPSQCGWLTDKFGLSWQIVPAELGELMSGPDPERSQRVMQAMLGMSRIDVAGLLAAAEG